MATLSFGRGEDDEEEVEALTLGSIATSPPMASDFRRSGILGYGDLPPNFSISAGETPSISSTLTRFF